MKFAPLFMLLLLANEGCPSHRDRHGQPPSQVTPTAEDVTYVAWMSEITAGMGLEEEIGVVDGLPGESKRCTQAVIGQDGRKYISYNRGCLDSLEAEFGYDWCAVATLAHPLAHHLGDPVTPMRLGVRYPEIKAEVEGPQDFRAFKFVGYVLYRLGGRPEDIGYCAALRRDTPLLPEQMGNAIQEGYENARDRASFDEDKLRKDAEAYRKGIEEAAVALGRMIAEKEGLEDELKRGKVRTWVASGTAGAGLLGSMVFAFLWRRSLRR